MDRTQAIAFVEQHGTPIEQARLQYILHKTPLTPAIRAQVFIDQQDDGGWIPFWASSYTALDATCYRLAQAEALGLVPTAPETQSARNFLLARQRSDGSWDETPPAGVVLPAWLTPGTLATTTYLTANVGFWLTQFPDTDVAVGRAAQFLHHALETSGKLPGALHASWLAIGVWHHIEDRKSVERASRYLHNQLHTLSASNLAWMLTSLCVVGMPSTDTLIREGFERLKEVQRSDGHWANDDGAAFDVHTTLEALRVVQALA